MINLSLRFLALVLFSLLITACHKDNLEYADAFQKSYRTWSDFKIASTNSYQYLVVTSSWTGISSETTITVKNGKPISRSFAGKMREQATNLLVIREQWQEDEATLNSHTNGAPTLTLDQVYETAKADWLLKRKDATSVFETKNDGMISSCGYIPDNCADDCFTGITITEIKKI
jgi:hypothetical protein